LGNYHQGKYIPRNPQKFEGDVNNIIFRSSWELKCLQFFDNNPAITKVMSEEIKIPYWNPVKRKPANYFPDFYIELVDKSGTFRRELIEVKPHSQVVEQKNESVYTALSRAVNYAKWEAAVKWCTARGINFRIITEAEIYGKSPRK
jgi:NADH pyrophosphatase NudC (nudix superfamily)